MSLSLQDLAGLIFQNVADRCDSQAVKALSKETSAEQASALEGNPQKRISGFEPQGRAVRHRPLQQSSPACSYLIITYCPDGFRS